MNRKRFNKYYLISCIGVLLTSYYPLSMGIKVVADMISDGTVMKENYPKYIIPYTPISLAIIVGVLLMPICMRYFKRYSFVGGSAVSVGTFFALEALFEQKVVVTVTETVIKLEDWQMYMCAYVPPETVTEITHRDYTAIDILMGDYSPAFKLHFYVISVILILSVLNCLYGFGKIIKTGEKKRLKSLVLQSACAVSFFGLCILACFTAFWRDGNLQVSSLSAVLMAVFFILLGVTSGVFVGSFLLGKRKVVSVLIPSVAASAMTVIMYVGEMILLNGHLYKFGNGFIFESLGGIVLAPVDLLIIVASGAITALTFVLLNRKER